MPSDKDMVKGISLRFNLLNQCHVNVLNQIDALCYGSKRGVSKNQCIISCLQEYFEIKQQENDMKKMEEDINRRVEERFSRIKNDIENDIYQRVIGLLSGSDSAICIERNTPKSTTEHLEEGEQETKRKNVDLSEDANIMEDLMKWS